MTVKQNESMSKSQKIQKAVGGKSETDGIVLLSKLPGPTSFASLRDVKKALGTNKVGHTGTLDSFAQGLLVVCTGRLTKLAGRITEFDKTYEAVIHFGSETDTLEYTGNAIRNAPLPTEKAVREAVKKWTGEIEQRPPMFSAIHIDGKRASDLARSGKEVEIPSRKVTVFSAEIKDLWFTGDDGEILTHTGEFGAVENSTHSAGDLGRCVEYAHIVFSVSKGTYIRSLARDIAESCSSAAHLAGLYRTKVGNFRVEDAAGFDTLGKFSINRAIEKQKEWESNRNAKSDENVIQSSHLSVSEMNENETEADRNSNVQLENVQKRSAEIRLKKQPFTKDTAKRCGFEIICLKNNTSLEKFHNGKPLKSEMFETSLWDYTKNSEIAVFYEDEFCGVINKDAEGKVSYVFVLN